MTAISFRPSAPVPPNLINPEPTLAAMAARINRELPKIRDRGNAGYNSPPTKGYKRTYRLKAAWIITPAAIRGNRIVGTIVNDPVDNKGQHYSSRVFGSTTREQDPRHAGRWPERPELFDPTQLAYDMQAIIREFNGG